MVEMHRNDNADLRRRGLAGSSVFLVVVILLAVVGVAAWMLRPGDGGGSTRSGGDHFEVRRGDFDITVPASGELAAVDQVEVRNELETRAVITEIVEEGSRVEAGTVLIRFNDKDILDRIRDAEDELDQAQADLDTAEANLAIRRKRAESELAAARLAIVLADLALKSWEEGSDVTAKQDLRLRVETAEKEFQRLFDRFEAAKRLLEKEFISEDEYKRDEISLMRAEAELATARLDERVYLEYDRVRELEERKSALQQARDEFDRISERTKVEIESAETEVRIRRRKLESRQERLDDWRSQLDRCVITAPSAGLVVYASSLQSGRWGRSDDDPPQVGTEIASNRTVMVLPDVSQMVASVKVNEALSGLIGAGQLATVYCDALPEQPLAGRVQSVGVLAETGGWRDPNRRDYTVRILLQNTEGLGLKPSMACRAQIEVGRVTDAVHVPVQAIFRQGRRAVTYVPKSGGYAQRAVEPGRSSELYVEIVEGLEPGERVLLREPTTAEIIERVKGGESGEGAPASANGTELEEEDDDPGAPGLERGGFEPPAGGDGSSAGMRGGEGDAQRAGDGAGRPERAGGDGGRDGGGGASSAGAERGDGG